MSDWNPNQLPKILTCACDQEHVGCCKKQGGVPVDRFVSRMERDFEIWEDGEGATEYQEHQYDFGIAGGKYDDRRRLPPLYSTREARRSFPQDGYYERYSVLRDSKDKEYPNVRRITLTQNAEGEMGYTETPVHGAEFRFMKQEEKHWEGDFGSEDELLPSVERMSNVSEST